MVVSLGNAGKLGNYPILSVLPDPKKKDKVLNMENKAISHKLDLLKFTI